MRRLTAFIFPLVFAAAACGRSGTPASPTTPSGTSPATATGATVSGSIVSSASAGTFGVRPLGVTGLTVTVVGTSIIAVVDGSSRFMLQNVPDGDRTLRFSGAGTDAQVSLSAVQTAETITLAVSVAGTTATIESQSRAAGSDQDIEGRIESLPPTTPAGSFVIAGKTVLTDTNTQFMRGGLSGSFSDLAIGIRAHVKATSSGANILATLVEIQNTNADIPVEINGVVQNFTGTAAAFQFTIDGRLIKGDTATEFFGNSVFGDLANGLEAEVKGLQRNGFVYASRLHVNVPDPVQDQSASIEGTLVSKTGSSPVLTLTVGTTIVKTTASTEVRRRGDVQTLAALQVGMTLHVEGVRQSDGSLSARMIQIKDDDVGAAVEIQGSMGGLKGSCPAISFSVNGFSIATDASTTFTPACSTFKSGSKVKVNGTRQADGSIKATTVSGS